MIGAAVNTHLSARTGVMSSLIISFTASAIGWRTPYGPTRIGPSRDCAHAITLRSSSTMYVTPTSVAFRTMTIFKSGITKLSIIYLYAAGPHPPPRNAFAPSRSAYPEQDATRAPQRAIVPAPSRSAYPEQDATPGLATHDCPRAVALGISSP